MTAQPGTGGTTPDAGGIARKSAGMAVGALVSRLTGFVRTAIIGAAIGAGLVGDAYATATMLPGIVYEVLVGGTIASIVVSLLVRARAQPDGGRAYTDRLLTLTRACSRCWRPCPRSRPRGSPGCCPAGPPRRPAGTSSPRGPI
ncbi:lipid II flippase MurJ [Longispora sp. NPDC051575]|uniref:lipid II flippase MurJ n=1 Tax=Longispora sp. NPDC051575 TaxID=3154943 RepID=UPI00343D1A64